MAGGALHFGSRRSQFNSRPNNVLLFSGSDVCTGLHPPLSPTHTAQRETRPNNAAAAHDLQNTETPSSSGGLTKGSKLLFSDQNERDPEKETRLITLLYISVEGPCAFSTRANWNSKKCPAAINLQCFHIYRSCCGMLGLCDIERAHRVKLWAASDILSQ